MSIKSDKYLEENVHNGFEIMMELAKAKANKEPIPNEIVVTQEDYNNIKYFDVGTTNICGVPVRVSDGLAS